MSGGEEQAWRSTAGLHPIAGPGVTKSEWKDAVVEAKEHGLTEHEVQAILAATDAASRAFVQRNAILRGNLRLVRHADIHAKASPAAGGGPAIQELGDPEWWTCKTCFAAFEPSSERRANPPFYAVLTLVSPSYIAMANAGMPKDARAAFGNESPAPCATGTSSIVALDILKITNALRLHFAANGDPLSAYRVARIVQLQPVDFSLTWQQATARSMFACTPVQIWIRCDPYARLYRIAATSNRTTGGDDEDDDHDAAATTEDVEDTAEREEPSAKRRKQREDGSDSEQHPSQAEQTRFIHRRMATQRPARPARKGGILDAAKRLWQWSKDEV